MARTRGASEAFDVQLDRQGNPVSPAARFIQAPRKLSGGAVLHGPGAEPAPALEPITGYRADVASFARNMEAFDLALLIDLLLRQNGGFVIDLSEAEFAQLPGDVRRHFMPVRGTARPEAQPVEEADEREHLRRELAALGIEADGRWGLQRLKDEAERHMPRVA